MIAKILLLAAFAAIAYSNDCKLATEFSYDDGNEIDKNKASLVYFSGSYCEYSDRMLSPFCEAAGILVKLYPGLKVVHIFCDQDSNKQICRDHGVTSYPQVGIVKGGKSTIMPDKRGPKDEIVAFAKTAL